MAVWDNQVHDKKNKNMFFNQVLLYKFRDSDEDFGRRCETCRYDEVSN